MDTGPAPGKELWGGVFKSLYRLPCRDPTPPSVPAHPVVLRGRGKPLLGGTGKGLHPLHHPSIEGLECHSCLEPLEQPHRAERDHFRVGSAFSPRKGRDILAMSYCQVCASLSFQPPQVMGDLPEALCPVPSMGVWAGLLGRPAFPFQPAPCQLSGGGSCTVSLRLPPRLRGALILSSGQFEDDRIT